MSPSQEKTQRGGQKKKTPQKHEKMRYKSHPPYGDISFNFLCSMVCNITICIILIKFLKIAGGLQVSTPDGTRLKPETKNNQPAGWITLLNECSAQVGPDVRNHPRNLVKTSSDGDAFLAISVWVGLTVMSGIIKLLALHHTLF